MMAALAQATNVLDKMQTDIEAINPEQVGAESESMNAQQVARLLRDLRVANDLAAEIKKYIGRAYDHARMYSMPDKMDEEGIESPFNVQGVGSVRLTDDVQVQFKDKTQGYAWLEENGHDDLITETVNASSLSALIRRKMRDGLEVPGEIFKVKPITRASITGMK